MYHLARMPKARILESRVLNDCSLYCNQVVNIPIDNIQSAANGSKIWMVEPWGLKGGPKASTEALQGTTKDIALANDVSLKPSPLTHRFL